MTTSELLELLQHGYDGDPWHGPSLKAVLSRITAAKAAAGRPLPGRHSIWELVLHLAAWTREVDRRLGGSAPDMPQAGDWPAPPRKPTDAAWHQALDALESAHRALESAVAGAPPSLWATIIGTPRDPALGTGYSFGTMVAGLATHYAYHAGQIALLVPPARAKRARPVSASTKPQSSKPQPSKSRSSKPRSSKTRSSKTRSSKTRSSRRRP